MKRYPGPIPFAFLLVVVAVCGTETVPTIPIHPEVAPWPLEHVLLKQSPRVTEGRMENGMRYAIVSHASPPGRISMRLAVMAGSLDENDDERGYAHFVEHMAFNGTTHFPAGELVKFLQREGAEFGPHINATTSPNDTIYKLELPDNSVATLQTGLRVFRDFADGILFQSSEVKRERGVILSEERSRHSSDETKRLALTDLLYTGTRIPSRQPIGQIAAIEKADATGLRKFYDAWYRPENMLVVIVGEIDAKQAEALVRSEFSSLTGRGSARDVPSIGDLKSPAEPVVLAVADPVSGFRFNIIKMDHRAPKPITWGDQLDGMRLYIALGMLENRLHKLTQGTNNILSGTSTNVDVEFRRFRKLTVSVASSPDDWTKALAIAEQEIRRVIEDGFSEDELTTMTKALRESLQNSAQAVVTAPSTEICNSLLDSMQEGMPYSSNDENISALVSLLDQLKADDCQRAFRKYWGEQPPYIFIATAAPFIPANDKVRAVYAASGKVRIEAKKADAPPVFQYETFGPPGTVISKTHVPDLDLWLVEFSNGVRLNLKRTDFERGLVRFNLRIGNGKLSEPQDQPGLSQWTGAWLLGGVGKHSAGEIGQILDGVDSINTRANDDALILDGTARNRNLPLALGEITAFIIDPVFRPEGFSQTAAALHGQMDPLWNMPEGPFQRFIIPALAENHAHIGLPDPALTFARTPEQLHAWIAPQLANGAIEIALVGDLDVEATIAAVAKTVGALPPRAPKLPMEAERKLTFPIKPVFQRYYYTGPGDRPSTLEFFWPVHDPLNAAERRRLPMLALILQGRVSDQVREKKGATYSPQVLFIDSEAYPGMAHLQCILDVTPNNAVKYGEVVRDLADKLARKGVTDDELARAKAQYSAAMKGWLTDNNFWLSSVLTEAQEKPVVLSDARSASLDIDQTTVADLDQLGRKYLGAERVFRYFIDPSARMPKKK